MAGVFSQREISRHNSPNDAWVVVNGRVFDVSGFLPSHPGGLDVLTDHLGTDVGDALKSPEFHRHSDTAYEILEQCCIGVLEGSEVGPVDLPEVKGLLYFSSCCIVLKAGRWSERNQNKWKEEVLIDWSKPLLSQVPQLGPHYKDWVHTPVSKKLRLFASDYLEILTKCPWWVVPLCWVPYSLFMMWLATTDAPCTLPWIPGSSPVTWHAAVAMLPFGVLLWTIIEYSIHRFVFHLDPPPRSAFWIRFHFLIHGQHHKVPFDNLRLVFPPVPASIIMLLLYGAVIHLLPLSISRILFAGGLLGYIAYDMLHYYVHHGSPQYGSYLAGLKSYHIAHHYINYNLGFGISSKLWDIPFGTLLQDTTAIE